MLRALNTMRSVWGHLLISIGMLIAIPAEVGGEEVSAFLYLADGPQQNLFTVLLEHPDPDHGQLSNFTFVRGTVGVSLSMDFDPLSLEGTVLTVEATSGRWSATDTWFSWLGYGEMFEEKYFTRGIGGRVLSGTQSVVTNGTFPVEDHYLLIDRGTINFKHAEWDSPLHRSVITSEGPLFDLGQTPWAVGIWYPGVTGRIDVALTREDDHTATYGVKVILPVYTGWIDGPWLWGYRVFVTSGLDPAKAAGSFTRNITLKSVANGSWDAASTWDVGDHCPALGYNAEIGPHTVTLAGDAQCRNLRIVDASGKLVLGPDYNLSVQKTITISGGELDVQGTFQAAGLSLAGGTLNMNRRNLPALGTFNFSAGTLKNALAIPSTPLLTGAGYLLVDDSAGPVTTTFAGTEFDRSGAKGTLVLVPGNDHLNAGENVAYSALTTRPSGIVAPYFIRQKSAADTAGDFLAKSGANLVTATYDSVDFAGAVSTSVVDVQGAPTIGTLTVDAAKIGGTVTIRDGEALTVASGGLVFNGGRIAGGTVDVGAAEALVYVSDAGGEITSTLTGTGGLTKFGPGVLRLAAPNYSGETNVWAGVIDLEGSATYTNAGTLNLGSGALMLVQNGNGEVCQTSGSLFVGDAATVAARAVRISGGTISAAGPTALVRGSLEYTSPASSSFDGIVAGTGATLMLDNPAATLTLGGQNTYTGATVVAAGTLSVSGSIAATSGVTVDSGGTLELAAAALQTALAESTDVTNHGSLRVTTLGAQETLDQLSGTGTTTIESGAELTAGYVRQGSVMLSGIAGHPARLVIRPSGSSPLVLGDGASSAASASGSQPVPEPGTLALLAIGLAAALGVLVRNRRPN